MGSYIMPIKTAILFFPLLAFLITLPYIFFGYRKYGSINKLRTIIVYSFILYLTVAYFLIILPLPDIEDVLLLKTPRVQLIPFTFIREFIRNTSFVANKFDTYLIALKEPCVYQVLYNFILLLPLGVYLRYYFKCGFFKSMVITFLVSLFFELTQLTGLYFIYPRSYRLFDVDDLIINTSGGLLGYLLTPLFTFFLPTREEIDEKSYLEGKRVSFLRRLLAFMIDQFIIFVIMFILPFAKSEYLLIYFIYYMLIPIKTKGVTIGKKLLRIQLTDLDGNVCKWYQYTFRYAIQYLISFMIPTLLIYLNILLYGFNKYILLSISIVLTIIYLVYLIIKLCINIFYNKMFMYEMVSKSINTSVIKVDNLEDI